MTLETPHTYIVAVSGGVDSCALLHMIHTRYDRLPDALLNAPHIVVAHVDHGMRPTSKRDRAHVEELSTSYGYEFESVELHLGDNTSEELARTKRYEFLDKLVSKYHADAVVTAHHADDVLETAVINMVRGTGRRGLSSLRSRQGRVRPLLDISKAELLAYAKDHSLVWNEDETNQDQSFLRNRVRKIINTSEQGWKSSFATQLQKITAVNDSLDIQIATVLQYRVRGKLVLSRNWVTKLDHALACEFMAAFLKKAHIQNIDRNLVERLVIGLKAGRPGTKLDVDSNTVALLTKRSLRLIDRKTLKTRIV